ncbi:MAG: cytochrome c3 family protein, partial [Thermoanaerobaculia bacterium]|nr:cytochrome c3 family protein [Thermoanaerobaculia bacterium]
RGRWRWSPEAPASSSANYRDNCTRCHNQKYSTFSEWGNGETYVMTGHKNMLRPVAPLGNTDPHFTTGAPWAGSAGTVYATDSNGNPIDFANGTILVGGVTKTLYLLFGGWVADTPRSIAAGGSYTCARCHTTGWSADATMNMAKQPAKMFGDYTGLFATAADGGAYTSWDVYGISCSRCHGSRVALETPDVRHHPNIAGKEATGSSATGATRVALCMDCHRQETGGQPYPGQDTDPGGVLKVGPSHESVEFLSHWTGNLFLNSPHGNFSGTFAQINDKTFYDTHFKNEGEDWPYQGNAGGCTQCHDVHKSTVPAANPDGGAIHEECTACHTKTLEAIAHPTGLGTPIESKAYPNEACVSCHMPDALHLFRINVDEAYSTFPAAALTGAANANTAPAGDDPNAVWVDLDHACGQCHGGGSNQAFAAGDMTAGLKVLTVDDATGFAAGERIEIEGAGAGGSLLHTYIVSVAGNTLNLAGKAGVGVTAAEVVQNPVKNNGAYFTKSELATYAEGIH